MYKELCNSQSDINEHLPTLKYLAGQCTHVTEMGVRYIVSTWAFLEGLEKGTLVSLDIKHPSTYGGDITKVESFAKEKGIDFQFIEADSLKVNIDKTDLLFLDTDHTYLQVKGELERHAKRVRKFIVFHDTTSCEKEIMPAINEFLAENSKWKLLKRYENNNGLTVIENVGYSFL